MPLPCRQVLSIQGYSQRWAKAGYDPREAIGLWERMEASQHGAGPPEFLSTHPSGATRIKQIQQWLPEALQYYRGPGRH